MVFLLNSQAQGVSGKMNNLTKHHGAGPPETRDPMQLHQLHRLKVGPEWKNPKLNCNTTGGVSSQIWPFPRAKTMLYIPCKSIHH